MATGLGSSGVDSARSTQNQVDQGVETASVMLIVAKSPSAVAEEYLTDVDLNIVKGDAEETLAAGDSTRLVTSITFQLKADAKPYDLSGIDIDYSDSTQTFELNDPNAGFTVSSDGTTVSTGQVSFNYLVGTPFGSTGSGASNSPSIKEGDLVEVTINVSGLGRRLATNTSFQIGLKSQKGQPLTIEGRTPNQLQNENDL